MDATSGPSTPLLKLTIIFPSRILRTSYEALVAISEEDFAYLQNIPKVEKMKHFLEATFYTYQNSSLFSLAAFGQVMFWSWIILLRKEIHGNGNVRQMYKRDPTFNSKCCPFKRRLAVYSLFRRRRKIMDILSLQLPELLNLNPLEMEKKSQKKATLVANEMKSHDDYETWVVGLRNEVIGFLQQTLKRVYKAFDQATDQVEALRLDIHISHSQLNLFKIIRDRALVEDYSTTSQDGDT